jgi:hypothetical protein
MEISPRWNVVPVIISQYAMQAKGNTLHQEKHRKTSSGKTGDRKEILPGPFVFSWKASLFLTSINVMLVYPVRTGRFIHERG